MHSLALHPQSPANKVGDRLHPVTAKFANNLTEFCALFTCSILCVCMCFNTLYNWNVGEKLKTRLVHRLNRILKLAGESTDYSSIIASSVTGKQSWRQTAPCDSKKTAPCCLQFVCEWGEHETRLPKFEWFLSLTRTLLKQWWKLFAVVHWRAPNYSNS